jgi:uncharacterized membrane protein YhaH (DUF805 family)
MTQVAALAMLLLDPRGRIGRRDLLLAACAVLGIELLLMAPSNEMIALLAKSLALWIGSAAIIKRLHDLGRSGCWLPAGLGGLCMWTALLATGFLVTAGSDAFVPGKPGYAALSGLVMLPAIGMGLWLHLTQGDVAANRFGPPALAWSPQRVPSLDPVDADEPARA